MKYKFFIDAYTPETIPMARLAEYMAELSNLLGETASVHFIGLEKGSTILVHEIEKEAEPKVKKRLEAIGRNDAPQDVLKAYKAIDKKLEDDNATGRLILGEINKKTRSNIIEFPGKEKIKPLNYGTVKEIGSLEGQIVSIGGIDKTVHIRLVDQGQEFTGIETKRELAKELAKFLWGPIVRLKGEGSWERIDDRGWQLKKFKVLDFCLLKNTELTEVIDELRAVPGSGWKELSNPVDYLIKIRQGEDKTH